MPFSGPYQTQPSTPATLDGNPITIVPLPTWPAPKSIEPWMSDSVAMITSPFTGQTQAQGSTGADLHGLMVNYAPLAPSEASALLAWLAKMRGMARATQMAPPEYLGPQGTPSGTPVADNRTGVAGVTLGSGGSAWTAVPNVVFTNASGDTTGNGAAAHAVLTGSVITGIVVDSPGEEYTAVPTISFTRGVGDTTGGGATAVATMTGPNNVAASTTLYTRGWTPSSVELLLPWDVIQIGYRLHRVLDPVNSDADGCASFEIFPSLREDLTDGTQIVFANPVGLYRLAENKRNYSVDVARNTALSFPLVEYR